MRVPIRTVKMHLFRARALLRERLGGLGHARDEGISRAGELRANLADGLRGMLERGREAREGARAMRESRGRRRDNGRAG